MVLVQRALLLSNAFGLTLLTRKAYNPSRFRFNLTARAWWEVSEDGTGKGLDGLGMVLAANKS